MCSELERSEQVLASFLLTCHLPSRTLTPSHLHLQTNMYSADVDSLGAVKHRRGRAEGVAELGVRVPPLQGGGFDEAVDRLVSATQAVMRNGRVKSAWLTAARTRKPRSASARTMCRAVNGAWGVLWLWTHDPRKLKAPVTRTRSPETRGAMVWTR